MTTSKTSTLGKTSFSKIVSRVVTCILIFGVIALIWMVLFVPKPEISMPNVVGMDAEDARAALIETGFEPQNVLSKSIKDEFIWKAHQYRVCTQSIEPNAVIPQLSKIKLIVSINCEYSEIYE